MSISTQNQVFEALGNAFSGREQGGSHVTAEVSEPMAETTHVWVAGAVVLESVHACIDPSTGSGAPRFVEYAELHVDSLGLTLMGAAGGECLVFPADSLFDVFPLDARGLPPSAPPELRAPPQPQLLQILSRGESSGAGAQAGTTVTLALATLTDCAAVARAISLARTAAQGDAGCQQDASNPRGGGEQLAREDPVCSLLSPRAIFLTEADLLAAAAAAKQSVGVGFSAKESPLAASSASQGRFAPPEVSRAADASEFRGVFLQLAPPERPSGEATPPYESCNLRVLARGLVVEPIQGSAGPWTVNWSQLSKATARLLAGPLDFVPSAGESAAARPPPSHPHTSQLVASCRFGGALETTSCSLNVALESAGQRQLLLGAIKRSVQASELLQARSFFEGGLGAPSSQQQVGGSSA
eukprot:CAMPEP_0203904726 /NCGR_PEP_ID=MMETSP0359-20131031/46511_1 /ASSEMBLY_ACC=CAM_ASM_000338 /TAXON_ID=268821 /ORGANISM="Scrippsiella Hangoei, Strain SHTV-5" /LENGTH=413 /DNA_ID=CAMNT_0050829029 /DNA_START=104 /DNA_END=1342 /DNA_ORIENTATION=+